MAESVSEGQSASVAEGGSSRVNFKRDSPRRLPDPEPPKERRRMIPPNQRIQSREAEVLYFSASGEMGGQRPRCLLFHSFSPAGPALPRKRYSPLYRENFRRVVLGCRSGGALFSGSADPPASAGCVRAPRVSRKKEKGRLYRRPVSAFPDKLSAGCRGPVCFCRAQDGGLLDLYLERKLFA